MTLLDTFAHLDWALVLQLTWQHIMLVGVAVGLAILIGVPLGIVMTRFPFLAGPVVIFRRRLHQSTRHEACCAYGS